MSLLLRYASRNSFPTRQFACLSPGHCSINDNGIHELFGLQRELAWRKKIHATTVEHYEAFTG
jgi:hypothetical protein